MPHAYAHAVELVTTALAVAGIGYSLACLAAAYIYLAQRRRPLPAFATGATGAPPVTILKPLKGLDPGMMDAFRSHCRQSYDGEYEIVFGVSSMDDPAAAAVQQLQQEFPERTIRLFECPERLGANGKVSTLIQLLPHAAHEYLLINDSDITVLPRYLERVMALFVPAQNSTKKQKPVGLVTALYRGRAEATLGSRLESMFMSTDFVPSVLLAKILEGGIHFGLGSTLAVTRPALAAAGGLEALVNQLADDYELGVRVDKSGFRVALAPVAVETSVPAYGWRGFVDHQLRWYRTIRDARPVGYCGLVFTYALPWALLNALASGLSPLSLWLLALSFFLRLAVAMTAGASILGDHQVLPSLWLLPLRDAVAMGLWAAGFAGNTIVWRGERFVVKNGKLQGAGSRE
jgi:ceramide glucosyltransferase